MCGFPACVLIYDEFPQLKNASKLFLLHFFVTFCFASQDLCSSLLSAENIFPLFLLSFSEFSLKFSFCAKFSHISVTTTVRQHLQEAKRKAVQGYRQEFMLMGKECRNLRDKMKWSEICENILAKSKTEKVKTV
jgi:hypothetical protein